MSAPNARICAVITEPTIAAARAALAEAARVADIAELRLDYLQDFEPGNPEQVAQLLAAKPLPVIATFRAIDEGGQQSIEESLRLRTLSGALASGADYCDIELAHFGAEARALLDPQRLILSYHSFDRTPGNLDAIYSRLIEQPAAVYKIAAKATDIADSIAIFRLLERANSEGRTLIALAMGEAGNLTRLLGPSRGSF
jgi:3-dehydroquinate dehydratase type I